MTSVGLHFWHSIEKIKTKLKKKENDLKKDVKIFHHDKSIV